MYGYPCLTETASLIEEAVREGQDAELVAALVDEFAELSSRIQSGMTLLLRALACAKTRSFPGSERVVKRSSGAPEPSPGRGRRVRFFVLHGEETLGLDLDLGLGLRLGLDLALRLRLRCGGRDGVSN